jgi:peptidyl-prolyl cis-trans isomerase B (cyclophilin B)
MKLLFRTRSACLPWLAAVWLVISCSAPKAFRKLAPDEQAAIRAAKQTIPKKDTVYHVLVMTTQGNMVLKLYNATPLHRDNFAGKARAGFYDSLLFHRVINKFMIQGGDPTSKHAGPGDRPGSGSAPGDRIPAEFRTDQGIYHQRGALAAARDQNPEKASSNCQFYIVQRKAWRPEELDSMARQRDLTLNDAQRKLYTTVGGTPHLDGGYTVFGELESGFAVLDSIAATPTRPGNRPVTDVRMRVFLLNELKR